MNIITLKAYPKSQGVFRTIKNGFHTSQPHRRAIPLVSQTLIIIFRNGEVIIVVFLQRSKELANKVWPIEVALGHFDNFYGSSFGGTIWRSARLALLSEPKYMAVVNPFGNVEQT